VGELRTAEAALCSGEATQPTLGSQGAREPGGKANILHLSANSEALRSVPEHAKKAKAASKEPSGMAPSGPLHPDGTARTATARDPELNTHVPSATDAKGEWPSEWNGRNRLQNARASKALLEAINSGRAKAKVRPGVNEGAVDFALYSKAEARSLAEGAVFFDTDTLLAIAGLPGFVVEVEDFNWSINFPRHWHGSLKTLGWWETGSDRHHLAKFFDLVKDSRERHATRPSIFFGSVGNPHVDLQRTDREDLRWPYRFLARAGGSESTWSYFRGGHAFPIPTAVALSLEFPPGVLSGVWYSMKDGKRFVHFSDTDYRGIGTVGAPSRERAREQFLDKTRALNVVFRVDLKSDDNQSMMLWLLQQDAERSPGQLRRPTMETLLPLFDGAVGSGKHINAMGFWSRAGKDPSLRGRKRA